MSNHLLHPVTAFGRTQSIRQWSKETGISIGCIRFRVVEQGWDHERAVTERPLTREDTARNASKAAALKLRGQARPPRERSPLWPEADGVPYENDMVARVLVRDHGPFNLDEIGRMFGLCREAVRQVEERALTKLKANARKLGISLEELRATFARERDAQEQTYPDWDIGGRP